MSQTLLRGIGLRIGESTGGTCLVNLAPLRLPRLGTLSHDDPQVGSPVHGLHGTAKHDSDHVVIGSNVRLRVVDGVEQARLSLVSRLQGTSAVMPRTNLTEGCKSAGRGQVQRRNGSESGQHR